MDTLFLTAADQDSSEQIFSTLSRESNCIFLPQVSRGSISRISRNLLRFGRERAVTRRRKRGRKQRKGRRGVGVHEDWMRGRLPAEWTRAGVGVYP